MMVQQSENNRKHVVIIGPAYPLRGGLASFDERLARAFDEQGSVCEIYTFSLQYPSFLFPGKTQYSTDDPPQDLSIKVCINSVNPLSWIKVGMALKQKKPDLVVIRYWIPFMSPCLGTIMRILKKNHHTRVVCIADNILPHEKRPGDRLFTRYLIGSVDRFITMSKTVMEDLRRFTKKPATCVTHPLYDNFGIPVSIREARVHLGIPVEDKIILFFGFIRKYKGLDILLQAMADERIRKAGIRLLIAGEFYENRKDYDDLIEKLQLGSSLILKTEFIADREVRYILSAADFVIQPYRNATQSGVTPLAYHFEKPMLVSKVGGLPDLVPEGRSGLHCEPEPVSVATGILELYNLGSDHFMPTLREEKKKYSWHTLVNTLLTEKD